MNKIKVYGAVILHGKGIGDDDIATINPKQRMLYGIDWKYDGDQFWEESNICVVYGGNNKNISFGGRTGLCDALKFISEQKSK